MWCAYRNKRGSLNIGRRIEQAIAPLTAWYVRCHSKNPENVYESDFMPHEDEPILTFEEAQRRWGD